MTMFSVGSVVVVFMCMFDCVGMCAAVMGMREGMLMKVGMGPNQRIRDY